VWTGFLKGGWNAGKRERKKIVVEWRKRKTEKNRAKGE
jgi:hypothetical protein